MEVKILEPIRSYIKEFNSPVEFNIWYSKNKDDIDKLTTHKLNKMYHIIGYRITKIKGELMLKEDKKIDKECTIESSEDLYEKILTMETEINNIKETVNKLIEFIKEQ